MHEAGHKDPISEPEDDSGTLAFIQVPEDKLVVRLKAAMKKSVSWLAERKVSEAIECVAVVGIHGQVVIRPKEQMPLAWKKVAGSLESKAARFGEERQPWFEIARLRAASSLVKVSIEPGGRVAIYLSTVLAEAKIGPSRDEEAVVLAQGEILEVWRRDNWDRWLLRSGEEADVKEKAAIQSINKRAD